METVNTKRLKAQEEVNHPDHYGGDTPYETIKVLQAWLTPEQFVGFCRGNALKYLSRAGKKGPLLTDLAKAKFYQDYEIKTTRPLLGIEVVIDGEKHMMHPDDVRYIYPMEINSELLRPLCSKHGTYDGDICPLCKALEDSQRAQRDAVTDSEKLLFAKALFQEIANRPTKELNPDGEDQAAAAMQLIAKEALEKL